MLIGLKQTKLLWMAGEITLARRRIREALQLMESSNDRAFFESCYHFEKEQFKQFDRFYLFESPDFLAAVRQGDHDAIAEALLFLEADPYCFRSGYMKKKLCSALRHAPLVREERHRIRELVLKAVNIQRPVSFAGFASLGSCFYTPGFHTRARNLKILPFKYTRLRKNLLLKRLDEAKLRQEKSCPREQCAATPVPSSETPPALPLLKRFFPGARVVERVLAFFRAFYG